MKNFFTLLIFIFCASLVSGQRTCGTESFFEKEQIVRPGQTQKSMDAFRSWQKERETSNKKAIPVTIPVHVIIVHPTNDAIGQGDNLSLAHIQSQIDVLNEDFGRTNADANDTPSGFEVGASEISFCLATIDPDGNPTDGVTRYPSNSNFANIENQVFAASLWNRGTYLNLFLAPELDGVLGYSPVPFPNQLPGADGDGVVILTSSFGSGDFATDQIYNLGRTATHEIGHWLGLRHIWGTGNGDCGTDDGFDDTPNQMEANYGCPTHPSPSCGNSGDMFMNYMDYVNDNCMNSFSPEQIDYMQFILEETRSTLIDGAGLACVPNGTPILSIAGQTNVVCPGGTDGSVSINAISGTPPYTFSLNSGANQASGNFNNLAPGDYQVLVTESEGNTSTINFTITMPDPFEFGTAALIGSCPGSNSGSFTVEPIGGNGVFPNLSLQTADGQTINQSIIFNEPFANGIPAGWVAENQWKFGNSTDLSSQFFIFPPNDGFLAVNDDQLGDGVNGSGNLTTPVISVPAQGDYVFSFNLYFLNGDYDGTDETAVLSMSNNNGSSWMELGDLPVTADANGSFWANVVVDLNDLAPSSLQFRFEYGDGGGWNFGLGIDNVIFRDASYGAFANLASGSHTLTATDAIGCQYIETIDITAEEAPAFDVIEIQDSPCDESILTFVNILAFNPTEILSYELNGVTNQNGSFSDLPAGTFIATLTGNNGCTATLPIEILPADDIVFFLDVQDALCAGGNDGFIDIDATSSVGPVTITLDGVEIGNSAGGLSPGTYELVVLSTISGCTESIPFTISEPSALIATVTATTPATCLEGGSLSVSTTGGTAPYTYTLNGNVSADGMFSGLPAGTIEVIVTDAIGCQAITSAAIAQDGEVLGINVSETTCSASPLSYTQTFCTSDGSNAAWNINDGDGNPLTGSSDADCFEMDFGMFMMNNQDSYNFVISVESSEGCTSSISMVVATPPVLMSSLLNDLIICEGESASATIDNFSDFSEVSLNGQAVDASVEISGNPGDSFILETIDFNNCHTSYNLAVDILTTPIASAGEINNATSSTGGSIELIGTAGTSPYSFSVNGVSNTDGFFGDLPAGDYVAEISDAVGCSSIFEFTIGLDSSIDDILLENLLRVFPNPTSNWIQLEIIGQEAIDKMNIYDVTGKLVMVPASTSSQINLSELGNGMYILEYQIGDKFGYTRVVKH